MSALTEKINWGERKGVGPKVSDTFHWAGQIIRGSQKSSVQLAAHSSWASVSTAVAAALNSCFSITFWCGLNTRDSPDAPLPRHHPTGFPAVTFSIWQEVSMECSPRAPALSTESWWLCLKTRRRQKLGVGCSPEAELLVRCARSWVQPRILSGKKSIENVLWTSPTTRTADCIPILIMTTTSWILLKNSDYNTKSILEKLM